jgi:beta-methylarginine biosynthesis bifunctional aminotransferase
MDNKKMPRITSKLSPYTFLQQRLQYVANHPGRNFTSIVENIPRWPNPRDLPMPGTQFLENYAPCHGLPVLVDAICQRERKKYGLALEQHNVLVTNGAIHALDLVFRHHYRPGMAVLCQAPVLTNIAQILCGCGYETVFFETHKGALDFDWLRRQAVPDKTIIYINSPHNPSGDILSEETMQSLARLAEELRILVVADMVYDSFSFVAEPVALPLLYTSIWSRVVVVNSMSKNYGYPGLRIGWIVSDSPVIAAMAGRLEQECIAVCSVAQELAQKVLNMSNQPLIERVADGRKVIEGIVADWRDISYLPPLGGIQFFIEMPVADVEAFADCLLERFDLVLTTASNYAGTAKPMGYPRPIIERALALLAEGLDQHLRSPASEAAPLSCRAGRTQF